MGLCSCLGQNTWKKKNCIKILVFTGLNNMIENRRVALLYGETIMKHFAFLRSGSTCPETQVGSLILILTDGSMNKNEQFEHETPFKIRMLKTDILKFKMHWLISVIGVCTDILYVMFPKTSYHCSKFYDTSLTLTKNSVRFATFCIQYDTY